MQHTLRFFLFKMPFISYCYLFWFLYYSHFKYRRAQRKFRRLNVKQHVYLNPCFFLRSKLEDKKIYLVLGEDKPVPLQPWRGPEGSRKLRFPDFMITAQDGGKVVSLMHRLPLPPGNTLGTHFC